MSLHCSGSVGGSLTREKDWCSPGPDVRRARPALAAGLMLGVLLTGVTAGTALAADPFATETEARIVTSLTATALKELMHDEGYAVSLDKNGVVTWKVEGLRTQLVTADDLRSIQFHAAFDGGNVALEKVNEWNRTKRFSRSYLDDEGDPHLELDLDLSGGVSTERIRDFLRTSRTSFDAWCRDVVAAP